MADRAQKGRDWLTNFSASTAAGLAVLIVVAIAAAVLSAISPWKTWLVGTVRVSILQLIVALFLAAIFGWLATWIYLKRSIAKRSDASPFSSGAHLRDRVLFRPDQFEDRVISVLREADGRWLSVDNIKDRLDATSRQDVRQALLHLETERWVEGHRDNHLMHEQARSFRLNDQGITYARERGFKTKAEKDAVRRLAF